MTQLNIIAMDKKKVAKAQTEGIIVIGCDKDLEKVFNAVLKDLIEFGAVSSIDNITNNGEIYSFFDNRVRCLYLPLGIQEGRDMAKLSQWTVQYSQFIQWKSSYNRDSLNEVMIEDNNNVRLIKPGDPLLLLARA